MQNIRIVEIPVIKAAYSGLVQGGSEEFLAFNRWFSRYHESLKYELFRRDFLRYNERLNGFEWYYALPCEPDKLVGCEYVIVDLPGGLCAVASCIDGDFDGSKDWLDTRSKLIEWAGRSEQFEIYRNEPGKAERYPMFSITSPSRFYDKKISIEDMYLPIVEK